MTNFSFTGKWKVLCICLMFGGIDQAVDITGFSLNPHLASPCGQTAAPFWLSVLQGGSCEIQRQLQNRNNFYKLLVRHTDASCCKRERVQTKLLSVKWCKRRFDTLIRDVQSVSHPIKVRHFVNMRLIGGSPVSTLLALIACSSVSTSGPLSALPQCQSG